MDELFRSIQTPVFWFTTVFVGLLLSVFGAAIYDWLKILIGKFSSTQRKRNEEEKERIEQEARKCARSVKLIVLRQGMVHNLRGMAATALLLGLPLCIFALFSLWPHIIGLFLDDPLAILQPPAVLLAPLDAFRLRFDEMLSGEYPLSDHPLVIIFGTFVLLAGYGLILIANRRLDEATFWQRVLNRTRQLIEEDLESNAPDTDA